MQAVQDQLLISWEVLPKFELVTLLWKFGEGLDLQLNLEEILQRVKDRERDNDEAVDAAENEWFTVVRNTVVTSADDLEATLPNLVVDFMAGECPYCCRKFFLYSCYCPRCNVAYCMWCDPFLTHDHNLSFVRNDNCLRSPKEISNKCGFFEE